MPIYEYKCLECGKTFEVLQSISNEPLHSCIHCQGRVKKLISAASFQFRGTGFYVNDYKRPAKKEKVADNPEKNKGKSNKNVNS